MATCEVYRLEVKSPLHLGERGIGIEETRESFPSDSLFAALVSALREIASQREFHRFLETFLAETSDGAQPPFLLSSAFPYAAHTLFFPRPMTMSRIKGPKEWKWKRIRFVSQRILGPFLRGEALDGEMRQENLVQARTAWVTREELGKLPMGKTERNSFWEVDRVPRVTTDRITNRSVIYHCGRLYFRQGCGLFFLVHWQDESFRGLLEAALTFLGEAGIGGERSAGHGQFALQGPETIDALPIREDSRSFLTLSRYHSTLRDLQAGVLGQGASYRITTTRGWVYSPDGRAHERRTLRLLEEGSIFPGTANALYGDIVDVAPVDEAGERVFPHPVYRYGLAFPLGVREEGNG